MLYIVWSLVRHSASRQASNYVRHSYILQNIQKLFGAVAVSFFNLVKTSTVQTPQYVHKTTHNTYTYHFNRSDIPHTVLCSLLYGTCFLPITHRLSETFCDKSCLRLAGYGLFTQTLEATQLFSAFVWGGDTESAGIIFDNRQTNVPQTDFSSTKVGQRSWSWSIGHNIWHQQKDIVKGNQSPCEILQPQTPHQITDSQGIKTKTFPIHNPLISQPNPIVWQCQNCLEGEF